jgi:hypothetical protein
MEPTAAEISSNGLEEIGNLAAWAGMKADELESLAHYFGFAPQEFIVAHPRMLVTMPADVYVETLKEWKIAGQLANIRQQMSARLLHTGATGVCRPAPTPAAAVPIADPATAAQEIMGQALIALASAVGAKDSRKVKVSHVLDPADSSDITPPGPDQIAFWFANYGRVATH